MRDSRVTEQDNDRFLNTIEDYFAQPTEVKERDARPDLHYQVGPTPELMEEPKCNRDARCQEVIEHVA